MSFSPWKSIVIGCVVCVAVIAVVSVHDPSSERTVATPTTTSLTTTTSSTTTTLAPEPEPMPVAPPEIEIPAPPVVVPSAPAAPVPNVIGDACGGDLPPCSVKARESGGDYNAYNPTGCGGRGCYGAWQFSGEWAGKLGLPLDLSTATPEQQDAAARALWANGAGCSNWDAC